jgi:hypothetical protein
MWVLWYAHATHAVLLVVLAWQAKTSIYWDMHCLCRDGA